VDNVWALEGGQVTRRREKLHFEEICDLRGGANVMRGN